MRITRQLAAERLEAYLRQRLPLEQLVVWAEQQIMDGDFESRTVRDVVARLGLADVRAFGLTWEDCKELLRDLGFAADVRIEAA
jgi:hypothetical protein